jgi:hypothetical protein
MLCPQDALPRDTLSPSQRSPGQRAAERIGRQRRLPFFPQSVLHGLSIPTKIWLFGRMGGSSGDHPVAVWAVTPWQTKKLLLGVRNNF